MKRINRLFRIVNLMVSIKNQPGVQIEELAKKFNVSQRTIYRDVSILTAIGVPVTADGGFRLAPSLFIPQLSLTVNEANVLKEACYKMLESEHNHETLNGILEKINSALYLQNSPLYEQNKDLFSNIKEYLSNGKVEKLTEHKIKHFREVIMLAITDSAYVDIKYRNLVSLAVKNEILQPISLVYQKNGWLLIAKERTNGSIKNIRLESIIELSITNIKFKTAGLMIDFAVKSY